MSVCSNIVQSLQQREVSGVGSTEFNRKLIYSRFRLLGEYTEDDGIEFTSGGFVHDSKLIMGTMSGKLETLDIVTKETETWIRTHALGVANIDTKKDSPLVITSSGKPTGSSVLWDYRSSFSLLFHFKNVFFMEFAKQSHRRMIGTKYNSATLIDTETFEQIRTFRSLENNGYQLNIATMSYDDELVLSDGVLYDIRSGTMLRRLDKQNSRYNGVFHPNGREIILNSAIWDLRNLSIQRKVPVLDRCKIKFNRPAGSIIYAVAPHKERPMSFHVLDSHNYNRITTVNVDCGVYQLVPDFNDRYIATIGYREGVQASLPMVFSFGACKLYETGRTIISDERKVELRASYKKFVAKFPEYADLFPNETDEEDFEGSQADGDEISGENDTFENDVEDETDEEYEVSEESSTSEEDESDEDHNGPDRKHRVT